jgi:hypothetical protein
MRENDIFRVLEKAGVSEGKILKFRSRHESLFSAPRKLSSLFQESKNIADTAASSNNSTTVNTIATVSNAGSKNNTTSTSNVNKSDFNYINSNSRLASLEVPAVLEKNRAYVLSFDIELVLQQTIQGRYWLATKNKATVINKPYEISKLIVNEFFNKCIYMGVAEFEIVANRIKTLFPLEDISDYFIPPKETNGGLKVSGALADAYYNKSKILMKTDALAKKRVVKKSVAAASPILSEIDKESQLAKIDWLQHNIGPEYEVFGKWKESMELRQEVDKKLELYLIFKKYKYLASENGFNLVKLAHIPQI